jgi:hypothetical protein
VLEQQVLGHESLLRYGATVVAAYPPGTTRAGVSRHRVPTKLRRALPGGPSARGRKKGKETRSFPLLTYSAADGLRQEPPSCRRTAGRGRKSTTRKRQVDNLYYVNLNAGKGSDGAVRATTEGQSIMTYQWSVSVVCPTGERLELPAVGRLRRSWNSHPPVANRIKAILKSRLPVVAQTPLGGCFGDADLPLIRSAIRSLVISWTGVNDA